MCVCVLACVNACTDVIATSMQHDLAEHAPSTTPMVVNPLAMGTARTGADVPEPRAAWGVFENPAFIGDDDSVESPVDRATYVTPAGWAIAVERSGGAGGSGPPALADPSRHVPPSEYAVMLSDPSRHVPPSEYEVGQCQDGVQSPRWTSYTSVDAQPVVVYDLASANGPRVRAPPLFGSGREDTARGRTATQYSKPTSVSGAGYSIPDRPSPEQYEARRGVYVTPSGWAIDVGGETNTDGAEAGKVNGHGDVVGTRHCMCVCVCACD